MKHTARRIAESSYVVIIGVLAALGGIRQDTHYYVAAVLLTLPAGVAAVVVMYGGYPLISDVGRLLGAASQRADGDDAAWLVTASATLNAVALVAAACANVFLAHAVLRRRTSAVRKAPAPGRSH